MDQRTHAWIAVRAIALLEDENKKSRLVQLLKPNAMAAAIGAWIPDKADAKRGGSRTDNHVLKMKPISEDKSKRFLADKNEMLKRLGSHRKVYNFLKNDKLLTAKWWNKSYKGDVTSPGQHLANRAMALSTTIKDMLLLGDENVDNLLPGTVKFIVDVSSNARIRSECIALYMTMLSHFIADSCMPCHCDDRDLADYEAGLHKEWEKNWAHEIGTIFIDKNLKKASNIDILSEARKVDDSFELSFSNNIGDLISGDVWLESINICRASFAVSSIVASPDLYPYDLKKTKAPFATVFSDKKLLKEVNKVVMHDAVLNTAIVWKHIWKKASKE
jgi:hypothetical protein